MLKAEVYDKRFEDLIDLNQEEKFIGDPGGFVEGFCWSEKEQELTFSSLTTQQTCRWTEKEGMEIIRDNTNVGNGMAYDSFGRLVVCEQLGFRISRINRDMTEYEVIAAEYNGKPLNSPNDIVIHSNGMIYFTDPVFGRIQGKHGCHGSVPQPCQGIYMIHPLNLSISLATDELDNPNGLCFSPDETKMYFAESGTFCITVMDVLNDGKLGNKRLFAKTPRKAATGAPDGIKVDDRGNVWCTAPGGVHVFDQNGMMLGILFTPKASGNLSFGGKDMKTLFYGSDSQVLAVRTKVPGVHLRR